MPFSVGIGDVIAVGKLIKDITDSLRSAGGAKSEYQELTKELEALKTTLDGLDQLDSSTAPSALLDTIKFVATDCRQRLEVFWAKIERYESSLGPASRSNALRGARDKLGWTFCRKEEVVQLQRNLQFYSSIINMHLIRHVAGQVQDMRKNTDAVCTQIAERIRDTQDTLTDIGDDVSSQGAVASNIQTLVTGLHQFIFGEVRSFLADFGQLVNKVFASTQQIYAVVLEIRDSGRAVNTGWTYFQDPFVVEDAFGRKFPVPSEFDYDMLDTIVRRKFQGGMGSRDVANGNYVYCKANSRAAVISKTSRLVPGTAIVMALVVCASSDKSCPMPICRSVRAEPYRSGGLKCCLCNIRFDESIEKSHEFYLDVDEFGTSFEKYIEQPAMGVHELRKRYTRSRTIEEQQLLRNIKFTPTFCLVQRRSFGCDRAKYFSCTSKDDEPLYFTFLRETIFA